MEQIVEDKYKELLGDSYSDVNYKLINCAIRDIRETTDFETNGCFNDTDVLFACQRTIVDYINR